MITAEQLHRICPAASMARLELFVAPLADTFAEFAIDTDARQAAFLAQVAHESGAFRYLKELAPGDVYEGAARLGNTEPGDGPRFKGRGLIQITGRRNYANCAAALGLPLLEEPELLEQPLAGTRSAGWFWTIGAGLNLSRAARAHGIPGGVNLNDLADAGDFEAITIAVNGGLNGYDDRQAYFKRAQETMA